MSVIFVLALMMPGEVIEHQGYGWSRAPLAEVLPAAEKRVDAAIRTKDLKGLASSLADWKRQVPEHPDLNLCGLAVLLKHVGNRRWGGDADGGPSAPDARIGSMEPDVRRVCSPYVADVLKAEFSIPTSPGLLEVQADVLMEFRIDGPDGSWDVIRSDKALRQRHVGAIVRLWSMVVRSCLILKAAVPEGVLTGEAEFRRPEMEKDLRDAIRRSVDSAIVWPLAPELIKDAGVRQKYLEYLKTVQAEVDRNSLAMMLSRFRRTRLEIFRRYLQALYGEDRSRWDEVRQIVSEQVQDPDLAKLITRELTYRKSPGVWP